MKNNADQVGVLLHTPASGTPHTVDDQAVYRTILGRQPQPFEAAGQEGSMVAQWPEF